MTTTTRRSGNRMTSRRSVRRRHPRNRTGTASRHRGLTLEALEDRRLLAGDIQLRFDITDGANTSVSSVEVGSEFNLDVYIRDSGEPDGGVTSAFLDVTYNSQLASPAGSIAHGSEYNFIADGSLETPGLIDEVGGNATDFPAPRDSHAEHLLFRAPFRADAEGTLTFTPDEADDFGSGFLAFTWRPRIALDDVELIGQYSVDIVPAAVSGGTAAFSITGDESVAEGSPAAYAIEYTGSLEAGEFASVDVALVDVQTTADDHAELAAAISDAVAATSGVTFDGMTLRFEAGASTSLSFTLDTHDDDLVEDDEQFQLEISNPQGSAAVTSSVLDGTIATQIIDDDVDDDVDDAPVNPWQNPDNALDVNDDEAVTLLDFMIVLDDIDANGMRLLPNPPAALDTPNPTPGTPGTARYLDVNGDGGVSLLDAQQVADFLNAPAPLMAAPTPVVDESPTTPESPGAIRAVEQELETQVGDSTLRACQVEAVHAAAIDHFQDAGVDSELLAAMSEVTVAIADLPAGQLGAATGSQITIDINGDGHGWWIDPTIYDDDQLVSGGQCRVMRAESNSQARYDLLTVVAHELAHTVGLSDLTGVDQQHDLMFHELSLGEQRMPDAAAVDRIFGLDLA